MGQLCICVLTPKTKEKFQVVGQIMEPEEQFYDWFNGFDVLLGRKVQLAHWIKIVSLSSTPLYQVYSVLFLYSTCTFKS